MPKISFYRVIGETVRDVRSILRSLNSEMCADRNDIMVEEIPAVFGVLCIRYQLTYFLVVSMETERAWHNETDMIFFTN